MKGRVVAGAALILFLMFSLLPFFQVSIVETDPGWLAGWSRRLKITIDHNDVDSDLTDFPVLVYLSNSSGRFDDDVTVVFDVLQSDSNRRKIAMTASDGVTQCYIEIERWDHAGKQAWLWVKVPNINSSADTDLYLYFDRYAADNTAYVGDTESAPAQNVWDSNYAQVTHMQDETADSVADSTIQNNDMSKGEVNQPFEVDGKIGKAQDFDVDYQDKSNAAGMAFGTGDFTVTSWIKLDGYTNPQNDTEGYIIRARTGESVYGWGMSFLTDDYVEPSWRRQIRFHARNSEEVMKGVRSSNLTVDTWYFVAGKRENETMYISSDGSNWTSGHSGANMSYSAPVLLRHGASSRTFISFFNGVIDELRVSSTGRSEAWVKACYETDRDDLIDFGVYEAPYEHDVAVTNVTVLALGFATTHIYHTWTVDVNVTILNSGTSLETFNVTVSVNGTVVGTPNVTVIDLAPLEERTLIFVWNASSFAWDDGYTLTVSATVVSGETEIDNNTSQLNVMVKMPGDVSADRVVDSTDLGAVGLSWGRCLGDLLYNVQCDFNLDGCVDSTPLGMIGLNWGKTY